jgi:hypothetical protein
MTREDHPPRSFVKNRGTTGASHPLATHRISPCLKKGVLPRTLVNTNPPADDLPIRWCRAPCARIVPGGQQYSNRFSEHGMSGFCAYPVPRQPSTTPSAFQPLSPLRVLVERRSFSALPFVTTILTGWSTSRGNIRRCVRPTYTTALPSSP